LPVQNISPGGGLARGIGRIGGNGFWAHNDTLKHGEGECEPRRGVRAGWKDQGKTETSQDGGLLFRAAKG
jgi:hypothetical protein